MSEHKQLDERLTDAQNHIALMALYREEWKNRDLLLFSNFWKFLFLAIVITFLPYVLESIKVNPAVVQAVPRLVFPIVGLLSSGIGCYLGLAENERIKKIDEAYRRVEKEIPKIYRVEKINESENALERCFKYRTNGIICVSCYSVTALLAIIDIAYLLIK